jgi:hypothetical protein
MSSLVKGKSDPITLYELLGTKGALEHRRLVVSAYETFAYAVTLGHTFQESEPFLDSSSEAVNSLILS